MEQLVVQRPEHVKQPRFVLPHPRDEKGRRIPAQYRLLAAAYIDDLLIAEGEIIAFVGVPNEQMEPLDDLARERMRAYQDHLDVCAALAGKPSRHIDLADEVERAYEDRPREPATVSFPHRDETVPIMPNVVTPGKVVRSSSKTVDIVPQAPESKKPKSTRIFGAGVHETPGSADSTGAL